MLSPPIDRFSTGWYRWSKPGWRGSRPNSARDVPSITVRGIASRIVSALRQNAPGRALSTTPRLARHGTRGESVGIDANVDREHAAHQRGGNAKDDDQVGAAVASLGQNWKYRNSDTRVMLVNDAASKSALATAQRRLIAHVSARGNGRDRHGRR